MKVSRWVPVGLILLLAGAFVLYRHGRSLWHPVYRRIRGRRTVAEVLERYAPGREAGLQQHFDRAGVAYPPARIALLVFKAEKHLELWAEKEGAWVHVRTYPVLAASGHAGPKLREGDRQVPEGVYRVIWLNPNSSYHLSMKINYPNSYDRAKAREEGRTDLGGDIFIHGGAVSIGCVAIGDTAIEELFSLVAKIGRSNVEVIIVPNDIRAGRPARTHPTNPPWTSELHEEIRRALKPFEKNSSGQGHPAGEVQRKIGGSAIHPRGITNPF